MHTKKYLKNAAALSLAASLVLANAATTFAEYSKTAAEQENMMKGLSTFQNQDFEGVDNLDIDKTTKKVLDSIYDSKYNNTHTPRDGKRIWWDNITAQDNDPFSGEVEEWYPKERVKDTYTSTNWNNFAGMRVTISLGSSAKAMLSDEVKQYESLLNAAAQKYNFTQYTELFKAIAQAEYNTHKEAYNYAKKNKYIKGNPNDYYDLFSIDGSWVPDNATGKTHKTPMESAKGIIEKEPEPITKQEVEVGDDGELIYKVITITPTPTPTPTVDTKRSIYTVQESINIAAEEFSNLLARAGFPSQYSKPNLVGVVNGFEFGDYLGQAGAVPLSKQAFESAASGNKNTISSTGAYVPFIDFFTKEYSEKQNKSSVDGAKTKRDDSDEETTSSDSSSTTDNRYKKQKDLCVAYGKALANGKKRKGGTKDKMGPYKYSNQYFFERVFEVYSTTGDAADINMGQLPADFAEILRKCMEGWGPEVTAKRRAVIQAAVSLYGVRYGSVANDKPGRPGRNTPSIEHPKWLDCSSFVGQSFWRAKLVPKIVASYDTSAFGSQNYFKQIQESSLIPGDIGMKDMSSTGQNNHIGIYIGKINGTKYWIHCTSWSAPESSGGMPGGFGTNKSGVRVNATTSFHVYLRCRTI